MKMSLQQLVLRGIEGYISDHFLSEMVSKEWINDTEADNAYYGHLEAKYLAEQVYAEMCELTQ